MAFQILITDQAQRQIDNLPARQKRMVEERIERFADDPRPDGAVALHGKKFKGLYRARSGNYRIIYQIRDSELVVTVVKVGDRKEVYD